MRQLVVLRVVVGVECAELEAIACLGIRICRRRYCRMRSCPGSYSFAGL